MTDLFDNPLGLDGFEFLEFSAREKGVLEAAFERMGFAMIARHRSKDVQLWRQGKINFVANYEPGSPAAYFAAEMCIRNGGHPDTCQANVQYLSADDLAELGY